LPVGYGRTAHEVGEDLAVGLGLRIGPLTAHHRDVVAEAEVGDAEVVRQVLPALAQRMRKVGRRGVGGEGLGLVLVLEHDDEYVLDRRPRGGSGAAGGQNRGE